MTPDIEHILARLTELHPPFWKDSGYLIAQIIALAGGVFAFLAYIEAGKAFREPQSAKEAAEEARALARRRSLMEDLEEASHKLQQVGIFLQQQEWFAVQLRIDEIAATCRSAMTRWSDHLQEGSRNNVLTSVQHTHNPALPYDGRGTPDYHWYREDAYGGWSSKHGLSPVGPQVENPDVDRFLVGIRSTMWHDVRAKQVRWEL